MTYQLEYPEKADRTMGLSATLVIQTTEEEILELVAFKNTTKVIMPELVENLPAQTDDTILNALLQIFPVHIQFHISAKIY